MPKKTDRTHHQQLPSPTPNHVLGSPPETALKTSPLVRLPHVNACSPIGTPFPPSPNLKTPLHVKKRTKKLEEIQS